MTPQQQQAMQQQAMQQQIATQSLIAKTQGEQKKIEIDSNALELDAQKHNDEMLLEAEKLNLAEEALDVKRMQTIADLEKAEQSAMMQADKHQAEKIRATIDLLIEQMKLEHMKSKDINDSHHAIHRESLAHDRHMMSIASEHAKLEKQHQHEMNRANSVSNKANENEEEEE